jgi:hypothetical protein
VTIPERIGSLPKTKTIGIVVVASFAAISAAQGPTVGVLRLIEKFAPAVFEPEDLRVLSGAFDTACQQL